MCTVQTRRMNIKSKVIFTVCTQNGFSHATDSGGNALSKKTTTGPQLVYKLINYCNIL